MADALSRSVSTISQYLLSIDYHQIAIPQDTDDELAEFRKNPMSLQLRLFQVPGIPLLLWCDASSGEARPFIPSSHRRMVFDHFHNLSHPGNMNPPLPSAFHHHSPVAPHLQTPGYIYVPVHPDVPPDQQVSSDDEMPSPEILWRATVTRSGRLSRPPERYAFHHYFF